MREKQKENQEILKSGVQEFQKHWKNLSLEPSTELQNFMDKFLTISLSQNLLISEYLALNDDKNGNKNLVRTINPKTVADNAVINASEVIKKKYGVPPPIVEIVSLNESLTTLYVESHLQRMLYEIIKTSMISTVEHHWDDFHNTKPSNSETTQKNSKDDTQKENTSSWTKFFHSSLSPPNETQLTKNSNNKKKEFPPIKLVICEGKEDVTFMIKDKGGGIPDKSIKSLWLYESNQKFSGKKVSEIVTANGFPPINRQYSLPFSRVMARYFGGDLEVVSMEGRGTQIYLSLFKNETQLENLPDLTAHQEIILGEKKVKSSNLEEIPNVYANQSTAITSNSTATNFAKLNNPPWVLSLSWPGLKKISTAGSAV
ncbi:hypothetical protein HK099_007798 [Clydaea vesicula]|uniref:Protein-serine/threonine kinase n=1 Tax=Clydaea vesicula TaxID=447962 RepID=A0AAD5TY56_9FUNG|nr:hypothetical protein HK099_007798 [Clydaea vesicula]KAJ3393066.1 hypothetical protein HDU92_008010 [Lobulomyces angularis]